METKFTKGAWSVQTIDISDYKSMCIISEYEQKVIAHIYLTPPKITEENIENANLLSAAPDMFNALKDLYDDREVWSDLFESQQEFICRVLNKATGSSFFKH